MVTAFPGARDRCKNAPSRHMRDTHPNRAGFGKSLCRWSEASDLETRPPGLSRWALHPMTCRYDRHRGRQTDRQADRRTGRDRSEWPQARGGRQPPEAGMDRKDPPPEPPAGAQPCGHLDFGLLVSKPESMGHKCVFFVVVLLLHVRARPQSGRSERTGGSVGLGGPRFAAPCPSGGKVSPDAGLRCVKILPLVSHLT